MSDADYLTRAEAAELLETFASDAEKIFAEFTTAIVAMVPPDKADAVESNLRDLFAEAVGEAGQHAAKYRESL